MKSHYGLVLLAIVAFLGWRWWKRQRVTPTTTAPAPTVEPERTNEIYYTAGMPSYSGPVPTETEEEPHIAPPGLTVPEYADEETSGGGSSYTAAYNGPGVGAVDDDSMSDNRLAPSTRDWLETVAPGTRALYLAAPAGSYEKEKLGSILRGYIERRFEFGFTL